MLDHNQSKLIALALMVIDHLGAFFFPDLEILRTIGRFSMPFFVFLLWESWQHTKNRQKFLNNLLYFGLLSEAFLFAVPPFKLNVLLTFWASLGIFHYVKSKYDLIIIPSLISLLYLYCEYDIYPVMMFMFLAAGKLSFRKSLPIRLISFSMMLFGDHIRSLFAFLALFGLQPLSGKYGKSFLSKEFFYYFYFLHIFIFWSVSQWIL